MLMKVVPLVPGHFTVREWIALGAWIASEPQPVATRMKSATERG
jgi:hypothetical protein